MPYAAPRPAAAPLAAIGLTIAAMTLITLGDVFAKGTTTPVGVPAGVFGDGLGVGSGFAAFSRFLLGAVLLALLMPAALRREALGLAGDWRVWLRGALIAGCIWSVITAAATEPLATVFGAFFVGPLVSALLAVLFLGERMGRAQVACLGLGFLAVLLVVRPGWGPGFGVTTGTAFAVLAGLFYGGFLTTSRWLANRAQPLALLLAQFAVGAVLLAPVGLAQLPAPGWSLAGLTLGSALASLAGNLALILAYRRAPASQLAPLIYLQLIAGTGFGLAFFGDWPDAVTLAGLALLIAAGLAGYLLAPRPAPS